MSALTGKVRLNELILVTNQNIYATYNLVFLYTVEIINTKSLLK